MRKWSSPITHIEHHIKKSSRMAKHEFKSILQICFFLDYFDMLTEAKIDRFKPWFVLRNEKEIKFKRKKLKYTHLCRASQTKILRNFQDFIV